MFRYMVEKRSSQKNRIHILNNRVRHIGDHMDYIRWIEVASKAYELQLKRKELEDEEDQLIKELKSLSEDQSQRAGGYWFIRSERKGSIDYAQIPMLKDINLESFRRPNTYIWKLTKE